MKQTTFTVDSKFILDGHKEACSPWKAKLEEKFPGLFPTGSTFKIGDRIKGLNGDDELMIAQTDSDKVNFISLSCGNRWRYEAVRVRDVEAITLSELKEVINRTDRTYITVNGVRVLLEPSTSTTTSTVEVDVEFIEEAYEAASAEWKKLIRKQLPKALNRGGYLNLGRSLRLTDTNDKVNPETDIRMCIADGFADGFSRNDLKGKAICVEGDDLENVELIKHPTKNRWMIAFKMN
jgi:hypothetical protein